MSSTLSTGIDANSDRPQLPKHQPVNIDGTPITWKNNPALLEGALYEAAQFYKRTGYFEALIENGAVSLSNGKTAIYTIQAVKFVSGSLADASAHTFLNPCPPTPARIAAYDRVAAAASTPRFGDRAEPNAAIAAGFTVNKYTVKQEDADFMNSLMYMIEEPDQRNKFLREAGGSGRRLVVLLCEHAAKADEQDLAIASAMLSNFTKTGHIGELTSKSFNDHLREYYALVRIQPFALRPTAP